jgi:hypothetical protein
MKQAKEWATMAAEFVGGWKNLAIIIAALSFVPIIAGLAGIVAMIPAIITGLKALFVLVKTNPMGLLISTLITGAIMIVENWEKIKQTIAGVLASVLESTAATFSALPDWALPEKLEARNLQKTIKELRAYSQAKPSAPAAKPSIPTMPTFITGTATAPAPATVVRSGRGGDTHINVYPSPGMDEKALAKEIRKQMQLAKAQEATRSRSSLYDQSWENV